jgi:hypothetical protein
VPVWGWHNWHKGVEAAALYFLVRFSPNGSCLTIGMQPNTTRLSTKQAAEFLGLKEDTLRWRHLQQGAEHQGCASGGERLI